jgi:hypothetical protein
MLSDDLNRIRIDVEAKEHLLSRKRIELNHLAIATQLSVFGNEASAQDGNQTPLKKLHQRLSREIQTLEDAIDCAREEYAKLLNRLERVDAIKGFGSLPSPLREQKAFASSSTPSSAEPTPASSTAPAVPGQARSASGHQADMPKAGPITAVALSKEAHVELGRWAEERLKEALQFVRILRGGKSPESLRPQFVTLFSEVIDLLQRPRRERMFEEAKGKLMTVPDLMNLIAEVKHLSGTTLADYRKIYRREMGMARKRRQAGVTKGAAATRRR